MGRCGICASSLVAGKAPYAFAAGQEGQPLTTRTPGVTVRTPAEYRAEAKLYVRRAECADTNTRGQRYLEMAQACLRLADLAELLNTELPARDRAAPAKSNSRPGNGHHGPPLFTGL